MDKPVNCERCGRENEADLSFCPDCGQPFRAVPPARPAPPAAPCGACGTRIQPGFRFCGNCGAPTGATLARPATPRPPAPRTPSPGRPDPTHAAEHPADAPPPLPGAPAATVRLVTVRADGLPGTQFALHGEESLCGRCDGPVRLADDPAVSPAHARFTLRDGVLAVEDLGSLNGTFLRLRQPRRLRAGDTLRLGRQLLRLEPLPRGRASEAWGTPDRGARWQLAQLLEGGGVGEVFPLRDGDNVVGREAGDVIFPSDRYISGRHARLEVDADGATLTDTGSSNGTFISIAGPVVLEPSDQLLIGGQLLRVEA
jgi:pSer/pThr/pTyr-binding forkhead associated (FHA) protein